MGSIRHPLDPAIRSAEDTTFIKCVDGQEPQIHELWCLVLNNIIQKEYPTAHLEVISVTVGDFVTNYLTGNGRIIHIIWQISVNDRVHFWGVPAQAWGSGLPFICNL